MDPGPILIFIGVVLFMLTVYFIVGTLVRYHKGLRHFPEVLPNYRFWRECASITCDALVCVCTCGKHQRERTGGSAVLPTNPTRRGGGSSGLGDGGGRAQSIGFEQLDADDFNDFDEEEAMQPSVIVQYH